MIVIFAVSTTAEHPEAAAIVLVIVYVPAELADKSTSPVAVLIKTKPAVELKVPATPLPLKLGNGSAPFEQYGVPV